MIACVLRHCFKLNAVSSHRASFVPNEFSVYHFIYSKRVFRLASFIRALFWWDTMIYQQ